MAIHRNRYSRVWVIIVTILLMAVAVGGWLGFESAPNAIVQVHVTDGVGDHPRYSYETPWQPSVTIAELLNQGLKFNGLKLHESSEKATLRRWRTWSAERIGYRAVIAVKSGFRFVGLTRWEDRLTDWEVGRLLEIQESSWTIHKNADSNMAVKPSDMVILDWYDVVPHRP